MRKGVSMAKEESKTIDTFGDYSTLPWHKIRKCNSYHFQFGSAGMSPRQVDCNGLSCQMEDTLIYGTSILRQNYPYKY